MKVFDKYQGPSGQWVVYWEDSYWGATTEEEADRLIEDLDDLFNRGYDEGYRDGSNGY